MPLGAAKAAATTGLSAGGGDPVQRQRAWRSSTSTQSTSGLSNTQSIVLNEGSNRVLIVATTFYRSGGSSQVATLEGVPMSVLGTGNLALGGGTLRWVVYYMLESELPSGSGTFSLVLSDSGRLKQILETSFENATQGTPSFTLETDTSTSSSRSLNVSDLPTERAMLAFLFRYQVSSSAATATTSCNPDSLVSAAGGRWTDSFPNNGSATRGHSQVADEFDNSTNETPYPGGDPSQTISWTNAAINSSSRAWKVSVVI